MTLRLEDSTEFRSVWELEEVSIRPRPCTRFVHTEPGALDLTCQTLLDQEQLHRLLVYTAAPGSESHEKLQLLAVVAT